MHAAPGAAAHLPLGRELLPGLLAGLVHLLLQLLIILRLPAEHAAAYVAAFGRRQQTLRVLRRWAHLTRQLPRCTASKANFAFRPLAADSQLLAAEIADVAGCSPSYFPRPAPLAIKGCDNQGRLPPEAP